MNTFKRQILGILILVPFGAWANTDVDVAPAPDWSIQNDIEEFASERAGEFQQGIALLLSDNQVRKTDSGFDYVQRIAYRVVDRSGLESAATISRTFDPEDESLSFNFVRILRTGIVTDQLDSTDITVIRQEQGLSAGMLDGNYTALVQLEDIRVGDVIDYSFSGTVATPLWPSELFQTTQVDLAMPIAQLFFRLTVPNELPLEVRKLATDIDVDVEESEGWRTYTIDRRDPDPVRFEQSVPGGWLSFGLIAFSTTDSWSDIVDWGLPLFAFDETLPDSFRAKLDEIAANHTDPANRAVHALRLVQDDIRYLGLEIGLGSHVPRPPSVTLERGYGDCKDKSVLLVSALNYLGIDAAPALASLTNGQLLPSLPPMIEAFDHMIVAAYVDGATLWMDPTLSYQRGDAEALAGLAYGNALPIRQGQDALVELEVPLPKDPSYEVYESFDLPTTDSEPLKLDVRYVYSAASADVIRAQLAAAGRELFEQNFFDYYSTLYADLEDLSFFVIADDEAANSITVSARYRIGAESVIDNDYGSSLPIYASVVQEIVPRAIEARRTSPLALPYGVHSRQLIRIPTPGRRLNLPEKHSETVSGVSYNREFRYEGDTLEIDYRLLVAERSVDPENFRAITDLGREIAEEAELEIKLLAAVPTLSSQLGLDKPLDGDIEQAITGLQLAFRKEDYVAALTGLNKLLAQERVTGRLRGFLLQFKGVALIALRRLRPAIDAFDQGFELYEPDNTASYFTYIQALALANDERVTAVMIRLLNRLPESIEQFETDRLRGHSNQLFDSGRRDEMESLLAAIAKALLTTGSPRVQEFRWVFPEAILHETRNDRLDNARDYVQYIEDPVTIAELFADRETEAVWEIIADAWGTRLESALQNYIDVSKDRVESFPDDIVWQHHYLRSLRIAGDYEEAIRFGEEVIEDWSRIEAIGRDAFWLVNELMYSMSEAGQPDKADALVKRLLAFDLEVYPSLAPIAGNRAAILMHWRRYEDSLAATEVIENLAEIPMNDGGLMWLYHYKACSMYQLGREAEARQVVAESMTSIAAANSEAMTKTHVCLGDLESAAELLVQRLADPQGKVGALRAFMKGPDRTYDPPFYAELQDVASKVRARPEVQEALQNAGRPLEVAGSSAYWAEF